jgi:hypothetical protein
MGLWIDKIHGMKKRSMALVGSVGSWYTEID